MNEQVTEQDIRMPQFRDAKIEDLEFDGSGEVVRKDRFEKSMCKIQGMLHGVNNLSARSGWTCEQVVEAVDEILRFKKIAIALRKAPADAEFYHINDDVYVKDIDQEHLKIARDSPNQSYLVNFSSCEDASGWEANSAYIEYIDCLVSIEDMK